MRRLVRHFAPKLAVIRLLSTFTKSVLDCKTVLPSVVQGEILIVEGEATYDTGMFFM